MSIARGTQAEAIACNYLQQQGLQLLQRNFRCRTGEIDLVMRDQPHLVFVEVRHRKQPDYGTGLESVDWRKQQRIMSAAQLYLLQQTSLQDCPCRFDIVDVQGALAAPEVHWVKDAFQLSY